MPVISKLGSAMQGISMQFEMRLVTSIGGRRVLSAADDCNRLLPDSDFRLLLANSNQVEFDRESW